VPGKDQSEAEWWYPEWVDEINTPPANGDPDISSKGADEAPSQQEPRGEAYLITSYVSEW